MPPNNRKTYRKRPALFKGTSNPQGRKTISLKSLSDSAFLNTGSFMYDPVGSGLKSTQQIPIEWKNFENHTFFDSAQSKTNIAFDKIINEYPFQGTKEDVEIFMDSLTGFEKYVYGLFPKSRGYLHFSGTVKDEDPGHGFSGGLGTRIEVRDYAGSLFPSFSKRRDGAAVIDFSKNSFAIEYHIFIPEIINNSQVIFQKQSGISHGLTIGLSQSSDFSKCDLFCNIVSGSSSLFASSSIEKGKFVQVVNEYERDSGNLKIYLDSDLVTTSSNREVFDSLSFSKYDFLIGSGSSCTVNGNNLGMPSITTFDPVVTFTGSLDELKIFHSTRSTEDQKAYRKKTIYAQDNLVLYYKFNESSGSYNKNNICLDSSGNSLHSKITHFETSLRVTGSVPSPMSEEKLSLNPVLFPDHWKIKRINVDLLNSASIYDDYNPNLITRLVPPHFFIEGQASQGFKNEQGNIFNPITGKSIPGSAKMGSSQYLTAFLLIYAKFFDEIKIFLDHIRNILNVSYEDVEVVADQLIPFVAKYYGIELPQLFTSSNILEFIDGEDIGDSYGYSNKSLRQVQSELWKRFLINLPFFIKGKGTVSTIKSVIRSFGIDPESLMTIREFGGPTKRSLEDLRYERVKSIQLIDFSGSRAEIPSTPDIHGFSDNMPRIVSSYLTSSRVEAGYPEIAGTFVNKSIFQRNGISNNENDGLQTSGSFTYEAFYRFLGPKKAGFNQITTQSLARLQVTGSSSILRGAVVANLVAISSSISEVSLLVRPGMNGATDPGLKLVLTGAQIFNGDLWYLSFGRNRSDERVMSVSQSYLAPELSTMGSSSYFLRAARSVNGRIAEKYYTSSFFKSTPNGSEVFTSKSSNYNASGTFVVIGSQSLESTSTRFLTDPSVGLRKGFTPSDNELSKITKFSGHVSKIRFWSKGLTEKETRDHILNPDSIGTHNPLVYYNFKSQDSGSFQRLRADLQLSQPDITSSAEGSLVITNFSGGRTRAEGFDNAECKGFEKNKKIIKTETFFFNSLSPKFDLNQTSNKVRVRSYLSSDLIEENSYSTSAPLYSVRRSESPDDDTRFAIEFSAVKALEDDIMNIFSNLEFFDNGIGKPSYLFDENYPDLESAREVYFRRLTGKPEYQGFFNMYKWFSNSLGDILVQLIPKKTKFLGVDFVYESHPLERNRLRYLFDEIYLLSTERSFDRGDILLSQYVGKLKRF